MILFFYSDDLCARSSLPRSNSVLLDNNRGQYWKYSRSSCGGPQQDHEEQYKYSYSQSSGEYLRCKSSYGS